MEAKPTATGQIEAKGQGQKPTPPPGYAAAHPAPATPQAQERPSAQQGAQPTGQAIDAPNAQACAHPTGAAPTQPTGQTASSPTQSGDPEAAPVVLEVIGLTKRYSKRAEPAISDLNFKLRKNQFHVFVGANGAGKTTTIKALVGAYAQWEGKVLIDGRDNRTTAAKRRIGYIPEHAAFPKGLSARRYLMVMAKMSGVSRRDAGAFADRTLAELNMQGLAARAPTTFSSGQQKRLLLAQALVHAPDILIMDEPAANLDPMARHEFYAIAKRLQEGGKTIFLSSHILAEVGRYANYVTILDGGRIVHSGPLKPDDDLEKLYFQHVQRGSVDTGIGAYGGMPGYLPYPYGQPGQYPPYPGAFPGQPGQYPPYPGVFPGQPSVQAGTQAHGAWPNPISATQSMPHALSPVPPKVDSAPQPVGLQQNENASAPASTDVGAEGNQED